MPDSTKPGQPEPFEEGAPADPLAENTLAKLDEDLKNVSMIMKAWKETFGDTD